ncbi:MAG: hypothetical protein PWQ34_1666 [Caldanaerobacter sp.]|uniref:Lipoprotein n=1 Tax=Thermoanaerobacter pentosaceus TaxID=694059 RepID=A0ABT9M257_9THEO|nr:MULTISPECIES: hypothetical protein [Thermoanaerobacteraceae]MDI3519519.1 hypothetical protein [Caldanaerobacter sp.]MDP9750182.1 hypothetical protein [Thermoanaerobacter pentosaceus]
MEKRLYFISLSLLILFLFVACSEKMETIPTNYQYNYGNYLEYNYMKKVGDVEGSFSFKYPKGWVVEEMPIWSATSEKEASPDWGVELYKEGDKENKIRISGIVGGVPADGNLGDIWEKAGFRKSQLVVGNVNKGEVYSKLFKNVENFENKVQIVVLYYDKDNPPRFESGWRLEANLLVDKEFYNKNKNEIWHILASVKKMKKIE